MYDSEVGDDVYGGDPTVNKLQEIEAVEIDRANGEAVILMTSAIDISKLQNALPSKFHISEKRTDNFSEPDNLSNLQIENDKSKLQQLKPLILILSYISVASVMMNYKNWNSNEAMLDLSLIHI